MTQDNTARVGCKECKILRNDSQVHIFRDRNTEQKWNYYNPSGNKIRKHNIILISKINKASSFYTTLNIWNFFLKFYLIENDCLLIRSP